MKINSSRLASLIMDRDIVRRPASISHWGAAAPLSLPLYTLGVTLESSVQRPRSPQLTRDRLYPGVLCLGFLPMTVSHRSLKESGGDKN